MSTYDLIMLAVIVAAVLFGAWKGLAWQVASLAAIFASYFVALEFRAPLAARISTQEPWNQFIAMFVIYLVSALLIWVAFGFVRSFIDRFYLKDFDRQAGAIIGAVKGAILCILITLFAMTLLGDNQRSKIVQSKSGHLIAQAIDQLGVVMPKEIHPVLEPYLNRFDDAMNDPDLMTADSNVEPAQDGQQGVGEFFGQVIMTSGQNSGTQNNSVFGQVFNGTVQADSNPNPTQNGMSTIPASFPKIDNSTFETVDWNKAAERAANAILHSGNGN